MKYIEIVQKIFPWLVALPFIPKLLFSFIIILVASFVILIIWVPPTISSKTNEQDSQYKKKVSSTDSKTLNLKAHPNISFQKLSIFQIEIDKDIYQVGVVVRFFNLDNNSYLINGIAFSNLTYALRSRTGGILKKLILNEKNGEFIEDNYIKPNNERLFKTLLPYKFNFDHLGLYQGLDFLPFDITIFGQWQLIIKERKIFIKPEFYSNYDRAISLQEWKNLLKPISKIDVQNLHYRRIPKRAPKTNKTMYYLLYNPDRSATIEIFDLDQVPPAKGENGVMVFLVGKGTPPLEEGWVLLGRTYTEVWRDPQKLALYNSIYPPDEKGKPKEFGIFQGLRKEMIGY